jgi:hypothetical protein
MVGVNTAVLLVRSYLATNPHHEPLHRRVARAFAAATSPLRATEFEQYYAILRRIPLAMRHRLLRDVQPSGRWLRAVKELRLRHRARVAHVTILTRNCIDVVHDWVMQNADALRNEGIRIDAIIANGPVRDEMPALVRERADLKHVDYVGFGRMREAQKRNFVDRRTIYIGDAHERELRPLVKSFFQV